MSGSTSSPPSGRDEGVRSPFRFPKDYNLINEESHNFQMPNTAEENAPYVAPTAPKYGDILGNGLAGLPGDIFSGVGGFGVHDGDQILENWLDSDLNYMNIQQTNFGFSVTGELQFNNPALGLDQAFGIQYTSPAMDFENHSTHMSPIQTFASVAEIQDFLNTTVTQPESVGLADSHASSPNEDQSSADETQSPPRPKPTTPAGSSNNKDAAGKRIINTIEDFVKAKRRVAWNAPANDASIPKSSAQMSVVVDTLIAAIRNNKGCIGQQTPAFVKRWSEGATFYSNEDIEIVAWEVMVIIFLLYFLDKY
jgi:hypothetical protein